MTRQYSRSNQTLFRKLGREWETARLPDTNCKIAQQIDLSLGQEREAYCAKTQFLATSKTYLLGGKK